MRFCLTMIGFALTTAPAWADKVDYLKQVKPLLEARCGSCHGALAQKAKLRLDTAAFIKKGGRSGPAVVAGKSGASPLIEAVLGQDRERMPPENEGAALSKEQVALLRDWIDQGAIAPKAEPIPEDPRKHWAFQKPSRPAVPAANGEWGRNPIDGFISAEHVRRGLHPQPVADRGTILRRVTIDLTGLPPTREQLHAFLADPSPDAYEKVVSRLLASPQYGERWARHWMDVWRYSDWYGRRQEKDWRNSTPTMWRWRDWIVHSLNDDKGYGRMVQEMLAADEIAPEDDDAQAATGFLARNYYSLNPDTWMKDQVEHTAKAFLGLTLNCCHCHDHKFDPISQEEYFRFRAFFEPLGLRQDRVPGEPDPGPFKKYESAGFGKAIASGLVRVQDERFDALTRMYRLGNERDFLPGRRPMTPGAPAIVGGDRLSISPVALPPKAVYPGLKAFVRQEEIAAAEAELAIARTLKPADTLRVSIAEARLKAVHAVIAADRAKYEGVGDPAALAKAAAKAQAFHALGRARLQLHTAEQTLAAAKPEAEKAVTAAKVQLASAQKTHEKPPADYVPLTPVHAAKSTGRRKALAEWIASKDNALTARIAVNHLWMRHFGRPLVDSVFDFGRNGRAPSHPGLLDWLAVELMESNWSMKHLHRLIVTSRVYRSQSGAALDNPTLARDADNRWLWRYPSRRLEAEVVRDAMLATAGNLDLTLGGKELDTTEESISLRRGLYFACHPEGGGSLKLFAFFDPPDPCDCYRRAESLVPQQALALTNSNFAVERSRSLARLLLAEMRGDDPDGTLTAAFERVLTRRPSAGELRACREFLKTQTALVGKTMSPAIARQRAWESLARVLFNHHEFITVR